MANRGACHDTMLLCYPGSHECTCQLLSPRLSSQDATWAGSHLCHVIGSVTTYILGAINGSAGFAASVVINGSNSVVLRLMAGLPPLGSSAYVDHDYSLALAAPPA
ncbi:uncharacterized protein ZBAI_07113 [Zygosaccharomyces bailii ISA1307]|nr:uncharacterized protein ZBAI_07113 [Zygosaccharomyces bailii ISA1307]